MKQPKRATRSQKELMSKRGLIADNWMVINEDKNHLEIISKKSGQRRVIVK